MRLPPEEPDLGPWRAVPGVDVVTSLLGEQLTSGRPVLVGVDGRSGSGKSTTASTLLAGLPPDRTGAVVHTDDVAWHHSRFDWDELLLEHVLAPARAGEAVRWQPPAWAEHGRQGAVVVRESLSLLVVEGVGAARLSLMSPLDAAVWVQSDEEAARERGVARDSVLHDRTQEEATAFWDDWESEERPFLAADRPWERADLVVAGTDVGVPCGPVDLVVATRSRLLRP